MNGKHGATVAGERSELATGVRYFTVHWSVWLGAVNDCCTVGYAAIETYDTSCLFMKTKR